MIVFIFTHILRSISTVSNFCIQHTDLRLKLYFKHFLSESITYKKINR
jgi:hypothetical protein